MATTPKQTQAERDIYMSVPDSQSETKQTVGSFLSPEELSERSFDLYRVYQLSQIRESSLPQFDGMGYSKWNETNEMADISFLPPKKNKGDSRITTGITHEKDSSLVSFFLNMNFEGTVRVFYKDKEEIEIGTALTRLVRKTRELENYDGKRQQNYRNYVAQGTSFALEEYIEYWVPDKKIVGEIDPNKLETVKWVNNGYKKVKCGCESNLIDGKKVFLEDIRQKDIQKQPGVYIVEYVPRPLVEAVWGKSKRWKYVPTTITPTAQALGTLTQGSIYSDWVFGEIDFNKVEVMRVYRPMEQRYQIYLNGVPMLPSNFPLKAVSPKGLIPISKGDADPMNMFAYSKSEPSKTKIDQAVFDEHLQNMIVKSRQSAQVPRVNNSDRIVTPEMFMGGKITSNLDPKEVEPLIENPGITSADFSFYELFKQQIDSKTISAVLEGNPIGEDVTLGQYMDMQKKQMMKIGGKIDGLIQWEKEMLRLRVYNILAHGYQKDENGSYKELAIEDKMSNGLNGLNVMRFQDDIEATPDSIFNEENQYEEELGTSVEITYLSPKLMKQMLEDDDYFFVFEVVPVDKNNDKLTQLMFVNMIQQAASLFGYDSLQVGRLKKQYAGLMGKPYEDVFVSDDELQMKQQQSLMLGQNTPEATTTTKDTMGTNGTSMSEVMTM